jgi:hypothetical protein
MPIILYWPFFFSLNCGVMMRPSTSFGLTD